MGPGSINYRMAHPASSASRSNVSCLKPPSRSSRFNCAHSSPRPKETSARPLHLGKACQREAKLVLGHSRSRTARTPRGGDLRTNTCPLAPPARTCFLECLHPQSGSAPTAIDGTRTGSGSFATHVFVMSTLSCPRILYGQDIESSGVEMSRSS